MACTLAPPTYLVWFLKLDAYGVGWKIEELTSDGISVVLRSHDRKHSKRFTVSTFIDPRRSVTESLALEKSRSVSVDIGAIDRMSIAINDKVGNRRR
jgi:hypothetical protein